MPYPQFDRRVVKMKPLAARSNKVEIERDHVPVDQELSPLPAAARGILAETADRIVAARQHQRPVMVTFGAHTIKNGLAPVLIRLAEDGWLTHMATNGAGIIHDWEFAFQGKSSEDVRGNVARGEFGNWEETGFYINLALNVGAYEGKGYGESVGALIENEGLDLPSQSALEAEVAEQLPVDAARAARAAYLLDILRRFDIPSGRLDAAHPYRRYSVQAAAYRLGVPLTGHPMFGHDIIYNHPLNHGPSLGCAAQRDFLTFANSVQRIDGGVYLSIGSAVMSPMVFEKSMSMAQNVAIQNGTRITRHFILVVDLAASHWDWSRGEPPADNPDYYLRYNKSFNRMGGTMRYLTADNRDFLLALNTALASRAP